MSGLKEEERKAVVAFRLEKARETFAEVPVLISNDFYRTAANRLYYACFFAATALLIHNGIETHTHNGVKTMLGLHFIKENKIENTLGVMYEQLFYLRQTGDYGDWITIDKTMIEPYLSPAAMFIETIDSLINKE